MRMNGFIIFWFALFVTLRVNGNEPYVVHHENVLGTSFELRVWCDSLKRSEDAEQTALAEIDRMARIVSTYDSNSEFSCWQSGGTAQKLSAELTGLLRACDRWQVRTGGAFHPGVERISRVWRKAENSNLVPDDKHIVAELERLQGSPWLWIGNAALPQPDYPITFNAIAKGLIVDSAGLAVMALPDVESVSIAIGGDLRCFGRNSQSVSIPSPRPELTGSTHLDQISVMNRAVATSSASYRGFTIQGRRYSHLLDPRTGHPVDHLLSATVVANTAEEADVLATACSVLNVEESLRLVESLDHVECLLVDRHGQRYQSHGWMTLAQVDTAEPSEKKAEVNQPQVKQPEPWNGGYELKVELEINQPAEGRRYRRPYVAMWVEDKDGVQVKTLLLWVQSTGKGPRWIPDLKRWHRGDRTRKASEGTDLVELVSEATRKAGQYSLVWNGTDNNGKLVSPGKYTVYIEAAREHGTYQLMQKNVSIGDKPFSEKFEGNVEIKAASIDYRLTPPAGKK